MKRNPVRLVLFLLTALVLGVGAVSLSAGWFATAVAATAVAQNESGLWLSSAEAPAGTPLTSYSAPDTAVSATDPANTPDTLTAPDAIISWRVTGAALKPRENDVSYTVNVNGSCTYVTSGDTFTVWNLAPMLPQGAELNTLRMYYNDTSGSNSTAWLTVYDLYGALVQEWSVSTAGNTGNGFNDSVLINHTVDYSLYSYLLNWRPNVSGATMQLCGFRIFYTPPPFGLAFLPYTANE